MKCGDDNKRYLHFYDVPPPPHLTERDFEAAP